MNTLNRPKKATPGTLVHGTLDVACMQTVRHERAMLCVAYVLLRCAPVSFSVFGLGLLLHIHTDATGGVGGAL